MAVGTHWEWRVFGLPPLKTLIRTLGTLDSHFPDDDTGITHTDEYLWAPGAEVNVKLRWDALKVKRRLRREADGFELWTELTEESFPFPLGADAWACLEAQFAVVATEAVRQSGESLENFRANAVARLGLRVIAVTKHRFQLDLPQGDSVILVELAEVQKPEHVWSISVEGPDLGADPAEEVVSTSLDEVRAAVERLELTAVGAPRGYLEKLGDWA